MPASRPVIQNNPILTVRWLDTQMDGYIGPDVNLTLQMSPEKAIRGTENTKGKCIYQQPLIGFKLGQAYSRTIAVTVEEEDPAKPYGPVTFEYPFEVKVPTPNDKNNVTLPGDFHIGPIVHEATDDDGPRFGVRTATFSMNCHWYLTANIEDAIFYIASEMDINRQSPEVLTLQTLNFLAKGLVRNTGLGLMELFLDPLRDFRVIMKSLAYFYFIALVGPGKKWDHKPSIFPILGLVSLDASRGKIYFNDIWSNMHYGYIGRVAGFSESELIGGAAVAQLEDDLSNNEQLQNQIQQRIMELGDAIASVDRQRAWTALGDLLSDQTIRQELQRIYDAVKQEGIAGLDNDDDSGSILLGSGRLYDEYGNTFTNTENARELILDIVRRRRKYAPNSQLKKDAPEGICRI